MSSLESFRGFQRPSVSRTVGRTLSQIAASTDLAVARVEAQAHVQAAQVDALSAVVQRGLVATAFITQVEQQLAQAVPMAASRLQGVGDIGALGLSQVVLETADKLRRI